MTDEITPENFTNNDVRGRQRGRFAAFALWLPVVLISVTATIWFPQLPARFAPHWFGVTVVAPGATVLAIAGLGTVALLAAILGLIALVRAAPSIRRAMILGAGIIAGVCAGTWFAIIGTILANESGDQGLGLWPLLVLAAGAYGLVPFALSPAGESPAPRKSGPASDLTRSETAAWYATLRVPLFGWLTFGLLAAAGTVGAVTGPYSFTGGTAATITLLLVAAGCFALSRVRVTADQRGLRVVSSVFRVPLMRIRLEHIASASAEDTPPGIRGYRALPGRATLALRRGPSLVVQRSNGTRFSVSVPEPERAAALLLALAAR